MIIRIRDLDDGTESTCSTADFLSANAEAEELVEWAQGAQPGSVLETGGGAQPWIRLTAEHCPSCDGKGVVDVPETLYRSERTETCSGCDGWGRLDWAEQERRAPRRSW